MNRNNTRVSARFAPETRFEVTPAPAATFRAEADGELETLKNRLLQDFLGRAGEPELNVRLRRAANEAAALAWSTQFPLLLFPTLFDEKAAVAHVEVQRAARIRSRSPELIAA